MPHPLPRPTDGELAILRILWDRGPSTVRQIFDVLREGKDLGYTSALKLLQVMTEKGLVTRDEQGRSHIYRAAQSEARTQEHLVGDLLDRAFGGSAAKLVMSALSARRTSREEREAIRRLIDGAGKGEA
jgi:predicted transcriptional regulator